MKFAIPKIGAVALDGIKVKGAPIMWCVSFAAPTWTWAVVAGVALYAALS